jgi:LAGLIDADG DNA endonuclease family protein
MSYDANKVTLEWLAGFFDGEGCVSFNTRKTGATVKVNITQIDLELLAVIAVKFDGNGPYLKDHNSRVRRPCYEVNWSGKKAGVFLKKIQPYVLRKAPQVQLGIELASTYVGQGNALPLETMEKRIQLCEQLRELNSGTVRPDAQQEEYTN